MRERRRRSGPIGHSIDSLIDSQPLLDGHCFRNKQSVSNIPSESVRRSSVTMARALQAIVVAVMADVCLVSAQVVSASSIPSASVAASLSSSAVTGSIVEITSAVCSGGLLALSEIVIVTTEGANIARSGVASASSNYAATPPGLAVDGIVDQAYPPTLAVGDFWSASAPCSGPTPQWLRVALPWPAQILEIDVYNRGLDFCGACVVRCCAGAVAQHHS